MKYYINILEEWKRHMDFITSPFSIYKENEINDKVINLIYNTFIEFFGIDYFIVESFYNTKYPKTLFNENYFFQHLSYSGSINSYYSLYEAASLITYSKRLDNTIYEKLLSIKKDSNALRNYLFEVFIYRMLIENNISIQVKPTINSQELEGIANMNNKTLLIECKKFYNTEFNRFNHLQYCFNLLFKNYTEKIQSGIFAFIIAPNDNLKSYSEEKIIIEKGIKNYIKLFKEKKTDDFLFEEKNTKGQVILHIEKNIPGLFENLKKLIKYPFVFFQPSPPPVFSLTNKNFFHYYQGYHLFITQDDIERKILEDIRQKRRQHRNSKTDINLYFFENESSTLGEIPLVTKKIIMSDLIQNYINQKKSNDIICLLDRNLFPKQIAFNKMFVYSRDENKEIKSILESLHLKSFIN